MSCHCSQKWFEPLTMWRSGFRFQDSDSGPWLKAWHSDWGLGRKVSDSDTKMSDPSHAFRCFPCTGDASPIPWDTPKSRSTWHRTEQTFKFVKKGLKIKGDSCNSPPEAHPRIQKHGRPPEQHGGRHRNPSCARHLMPARSTFRFLVGKWGGTALRSFLHKNAKNETHAAAIFRRK